MKIDMLHFGVKIFDAAVSRLDLILGGEGWYTFWRVPVAIGWESVWSPTFSPAGRGNPLVPLLPPWNLPEQPGLREALTLTCWICPDSVQCTWRNICHGLSIALTENPRGLRLYIGFQDRLHIVVTKIISYFISYLSFSLLSLILAQNITTYFFPQKFLGIEISIMISQVSIKM